jgi:hypothetical protein
MTDHQECCAQSVDEAIAIIAAHEAKIQSLSWDVETTQWKLLSANPIEVERQTKSVGTSSKVLVDFPSGRYRVSMQGVYTWSSGVDPHVSIVLEAKYDGKEFRMWTRQIPGTGMPDSKITADGKIALNDAGAFDDNKDFMSGATGYGVGLAHLPPNFYNVHEGAVMRLSAFLQRQLDRQLPVSLSTTADGLWRIHVSCTYLDGAPDWSHIDYDPARGAVVRVHLGGKADSIEGCWHRTEIDSVQVGNDVWLPKEVRLLPLLNKPIMMNKIAYSNHRVNFPVTDESLAIVFPIGTKIEDRIKGQLYVIGPAPVEQDVAVRSFLEQEEVKLIAPPQENPWFARLGWIFGGAMLAVLSWIVLFRKRSATAGLLLITGALSGTLDAKEPESNSKRQPHDSSGRQELHPLNCGHVTTLAALNVLGVKHDPQLVCDSLPVDDKGVSAGQMRDVLAAHGLSAIARQTVRVAELERLLNHNTVAIIAVPGGLLRDKRHYFLALRDAKRGPLLCDVLLGTRVLKDALATEVKQKNIDLVLFVSREQAARKATADHVQISPSEIELGDIPLTGPLNSVPIVSKFTIYNSADVAVQVTGINTGCGCSKANWTGGIISPRSKKEIEYFVIPGAWGEGTRTRPVEISFYDGTKMSIVCKATGKSAGEMQGIKVNPSAVVLRAMPDSEECGAGECIVDSLQPIPTSFAVSPVEPWLETQVVMLDEKRCKINVSVKKDHAVLDRLRGIEEEILGSFVIQSHEELPPEQVQVRVVRPRISVTPRVVTIQAAQEMTRRVDVSFQNGTEQTKARLLAVSSKSPDVSAEIAEEEGRQFVQVKTSNRATPGTHVLRITVADARSRQMDAVCVVNVTEAKTATSKQVLLNPHPVEGQP